MYYTIYKVTNKINNKFYIGKHITNNLNDGYMGSGKLIRAAIKKYGEENFSKEMLHIFDNENEMNQKEKELVVIIEMSYNLCEGGKGGWSYVNRNGLNLTFTKEDQKKGGQAYAERYRNDLEFKEKIYDHLLKICKIGGQKYKEKYPNGIRFKQSQQAIENQKKALAQINHQQGSKNSQYGTCWITNGQKDKKIKKEELDYWLEKGYTKGRKINCNQHG